MSDPDLAKIELYRYDLPLSKPMPVRNAAGRSASFRRGWLVAITDRATGNVGYGDAAPLVFTPRELDLVEHNLAASVALMAEGQTTIARKGGREGAGAAAIQFALSSARLDLEARNRERPLNRHLRSEAGDIVHVNALVDSSENERADVEALLNAGYRCLKIKVGRGPVADDVARVVDISARAEGRARLRLDANRAWTLDQAIEFIDRLESVPVEYIEEPLERPDELSALFHRTGRPFALDESIPEMLASGVDVEEYLRGAADFCSAVVVKPTSLGSLETTLSLARSAASAGLDFVISSSLESGFGLRTLAALAAATGSGAAGLATQSLFQDDVCRPPVTLGAVVDLNELWRISPHVARANTTLLGSWKTW